MMFHKKDRNFRDDVLAIAGEEKILAVVISNGPAMSWEGAEQPLNIMYSTGYGNYDGLDILAWTDNYVIYSGDYDGSCYLRKVLRNPPEIGYCITEKNVIQYWLRQKRFLKIG